MSVFMLVGPTCAGKDTLRKELSKFHSFNTRVACTTRDLRSGEAEGVDYKKLTLREFHRLIQEHKFAEWAEVHGNLYGTLKEDLERLAALEKPLVFDLDIIGAKNLKRNFLKFNLVFIIPGSFSELEGRIRSRARGESEAETSLRLRRAREEIREIHCADYVIMNPNGGLNGATRELLELIRTVGLNGHADITRFRNPTMIRQMLAALG